MNHLLCSGIPFWVAVAVSYVIGYMQMVGLK